jgi:hypothetical protein
MSNDPVVKLFFHQDSNEPYMCVTSHAGSGHHVCDIDLRNYTKLRTQIKFQIINQDLTVRKFIDRAEWGLPFLPVKISDGILTQFGSPVVSPDGLSVTITYGNDIDISYGVSYSVMHPNQGEFIHTYDPGIKNGANAFHLEVAIILTTLLGISALGYFAIRALRTFFKARR